MNMFLKSNNNVFVRILLSISIPLILVLLVLVFYLMTVIFKIQ
jgi:hypothetical protein